MASMDLFEEWKMDDDVNMKAQEQQSLHLVDEDEQSPIFTLQRLDWSVDRCVPAPSKGGTRRSQPKEISKVVVVNKIFIFGTTDGSILRWNMEGGGECEEIELSKKPDDNIKHIFVDPNGNHIIVVLKNGESFYMHSRAMKPKKMPKVQGTIEAVGFDKSSVTESSTKNFLVGTSSGRIYEVALDSSGKEKMCHLVHHVDEGSGGGITSIYFETFSTGDNNDDYVTDSYNQGEDVRPSTGGLSLSRYRIHFVLCTTSLPTRLYCFIGGGSSCSQLFQDHKASGASSFFEPPGSVERSDLLLFRKKERVGSDRNLAYAILTKNGMYHGSLLLDNISPTSTFDDVVADSRMLPFVHRQFKQRRSPISIIMTEFHIIFLYSDSLVVQSQISGEIQQEENLFLLLTSSSEDCGEALALVRDIERGMLWLVTTTSLYQIRIVREDRTAWHMYLDKAMKAQDAKFFDIAHQFCKSEENHKTVHKAQADFFLQSSPPQLEMAATQFALGGVPFDEALLLLLSLGGATQMKDVSTLPASGSQGNNKDTSSQSTSVADFDYAESTMQALRLYLQEKLRILPADAKSQKTMISTWLSEIFLHSIASSSSSSTSISQHRQDAKTIHEFKEFVRKNKGSLDNATTLSLLLSRGPSMRPLLLFYSQIFGDYDKVVSHYINENMIAEAISVLKNAPIEKVEELIYKKAPILIGKNPELTVDLFLSKDYLAPTRLLPAIFRYSELLDRQYKASREPAHRHIRSKELLSPLTPPTIIGNEYENSLDQDSDGNGVNFAIYYLETYLVNVKERERSGDGFCYIEPSVQHALIWLLAKYDDDKESGLLKLIIPLVDTDSLYGDIETETHTEDCLLDRDSIDISYVLRECKRENRTRSCVYLYVLMNNMEKAVTSALEIDLELAKNIASRYQLHQSQFDGESMMPSREDGKDGSMLNGVTGAAAVGKKLWLRIIEHVVNTLGKGGINQVLEMLHDSKGLLRIEDILEHLPDFTEIDLFKEEICNTLEDYATRIENLKVEMDELSSSAEAIDRELMGVTTRGFAMRNHQRCEICSEALQAGVQQIANWEQFYLFPCGHGYHEACLLKNSSNYLESSADIQQVNVLREQIAAVSSRAKDSDKRSMVQLEHLQAEMDSLVAADCPLCGDYMIRSTGRSLLCNARGALLTDEAKSWEL